MWIRAHERLMHSREVKCTALSLFGPKGVAGNPDIPAEAVVVGMVISLYLVGQRLTTDGRAYGWSDDDLCDACCWAGSPEEFSIIMTKYGWVELMQEGGYKLSRWDEFLGSKRGALRTKKHREKKAALNSASECNVTVTPPHVTPPYVTSPSVTPPRITPSRAYSIRLTREKLISSSEDESDEVDFDRSNYISKGTKPTGFAVISSKDSSDDLSSEKSLHASVSENLQANDLRQRHMGMGGLGGRGASSIAKPDVDHPKTPCQEEFTEQSSLNLAIQSNNKELADEKKAKEIVSHYNKRLAEWRKVTGKRKVKPRKYPSDTPEWRAILKAIKHVSGAHKELFLSIDGMFTSEFNQGINDRNQEYLGIELAMRTSNIERFISHAESRGARSINIEEKKKADVVKSIQESLNEEDDWTD